MFLAYLTSLLVISTLIAWFEIPSLWKQKMWKEFASFLLIFLLGITLNILVGFKIPVPNPFEWIQSTFHPIHEKLLQLLHLQ